MPHWRETRFVIFPIAKSSGRCCGRRILWWHGKSSVTTFSENEFQLVYSERYARFSLTDCPSRLRGGLRGGIGRSHRIARSSGNSIAGGRRSRRLGSSACTCAAAGGGGRDAYWRLPTFRSGPLHGMESARLAVQSICQSRNLHHALGGIFL